MRFLIITAFLTTTVSSALAQSGNEIHPLPPPQQDANVSQINGQIVPVGEHNNYQYSFTRWNVSANPIGAIIGLYGASVSFAPMMHLALRADLNYYAPVGDDKKGFEVGAGVPIYFKKAYSGFFLEPGVAYRKYDDVTNVGPQMLIGWHWMWDSGLNLAMAVGVQRNFSNDDSEFDDVLPQGYLRVGYSF